MKKKFVLTLLLVSLAVSATQAFIPASPTNLVAEVAGNTVTLTWQAPSTGAAPLGYILEASLSPGGPTVALFAVAGTSMVATSVPNGVFYVRVRAVDAEGVGAASNEAVVAVPNGGGGGCGVAPTAPGGLTSNVVGNQVTLNWSAPVGCAATGYVIQAGSVSGASNLAVINVGPATTLSVNAPAGTYFVRVLATNASGGSAASNEVVVVVPQP